jgi:hypothetical protein
MMVVFIYVEYGLIKAKSFFFFEKYLHGIWVIVVKKVTRIFAKACWQTTDFNSYKGPTPLNIRVSEIKSLI